MFFFNLKSSYISQLALNASFNTGTVPMLWICGNLKYFTLSVRESTLAVRI